jgi:membrane protease YdiL (CAAX protease family)
LGAFAFSFAHLPFGNIYALLFTFIGGLMFLSTYRATSSLILAAFEHALFGDFLFTIGWGQFFFHAGTLAALS